MEPFKPDWYRRLQSGPFSQKTFTQRSMLAVEERVKQTNLSRIRLTRITSAVILAAVIAILSFSPWKYVFEARHAAELTEKQVLSRGEAEEPVMVEDISGEHWKGKMLLVPDPTSIRVVTTSKQESGERITDMVRRTGAIAGVNAGHYVKSDGGSGGGLLPSGVVVSDGRVLFVDKDTKKYPIAGFTNEGSLVIGSYTMDELKDMQIKEAVSAFPRIIANGKPLITGGDYHWGQNPRTAIGQKADGSVIFVVIEGRQSNSLGATLKEVQDLLIDQGAINAGLLGGGASSEMVIQGELVTHSPQESGEMELPTGFLVFEKPDEVKVDSPWTEPPTP
ncbi:phosphodiester glycosidase family protein [Paenibacillus sp. OAS669]|uniref:phosphodiester glycosidase family protein n=1 Tax=Paenibacillus sp. OAS669 TaxID=2663821 RepID=UPI00178B47A2|nr:phosphodiester glycosidase family protein [Paenibacillus sp. OAS669]MBE1442287.1 exopolysaccharide biosynthesis protein [Paenibacillus sp. OAS669]